MSEDGLPPVTDDITPDDSASQTNSGSVSSRASRAARLASLRVQAACKRQEAALREQEMRIKNEERRLQMLIEQHDLDTRVAVAEAEEKAISQAELEDATMGSGLAKFKRVDSVVGIRHLHPPESPQPMSFSLVPSSPAEHQTHVQVPSPSISVERSSSTPPQAGTMTSTQPTGLQTAVAMQPTTPSVFMKQFPQRRHGRTRHHIEHVTRNLSQTA